MEGYAMLKRFAFQTQVVRKPKKTDKEAPATMEAVIGDHAQSLINELGKDLLKKTAITVGIVIASLKVIDILGEIAVKKTKSADNQ